LEVVSTNWRHGRDDVAIFEVGKGYGRGDKPSDSPKEWWRLGLALVGAAEPRSWNRSLRAFDLDDAKGIIELICRELSLPEPAYSALTADPSFHPGRSVRVDAAGRLSGRVGELHPATIDALDLRIDRVVVAEVATAGLA